MSGPVTKEEMGDAILEGLVHAVADHRITGDADQFKDAPSDHDIRHRITDAQVFVTWCDTCSPGDGGRITLGG